MVRPKPDDVIKKPTKELKPITKSTPKPAPKPTPDFKPLLGMNSGSGSYKPSIDSRYGHMKRGG